LITAVRQSDEKAHTNPVVAELDGRQPQHKGVIVLNLLMFTIAFLVPTQPLRNAREEP